MTSFWRHSRLNHYDLRPDFLTQCVKLLSGEVCQGSKRNSRYFGSYSWKNTGVLTAPIRVKIKPHLIASHLLFNNITFYCTIQSWHWHKSASRFVPHPRGPKNPSVVFCQELPKLTLYNYMTNIDSNDVRKIAKLMNTQRFDILHHLIIYRMTSYDRLHHLIIFRNVRYSLILLFFAHHYYQLPKYRENRFETSHTSPTNNFTYCVKNSGRRS